MKVLVTGADGFIGSHLVPALLQAGHSVVAGSRSNSAFPGAISLRSPDLSIDADWMPCLAGVHAVVHLAGRAHVIQESSEPDCANIYFQVNTEGTRALARQAAAAGAIHFVFLSSCHAVAAASTTMITEATPPDPGSPYGRSKLEAEAALKSELKGTACSYTILRPPLVYGPGNLANFARLINLVKTGLPLPFATIHNRRSFIGVQNLTDLILNCIGNEKALERMFFPSDGADVSTPDLIRTLANAFRLPPRLFPLPDPLLRAVSHLPGLSMLGKIMASLYVDSAPLRNELGWHPPLSLGQGLRLIAEKTNV